MHPLYIRVTYNRKTVTLNSYCFNQFVVGKQNVSQNFLNDVIQKERGVIENIVKKVETSESSFSLESFKEYYKKYSINILDFVNQYLLNEVVIYANKNEKKRLAKLAEDSVKHFSIFYIMSLLREINIGLYNKVDEYLKHAYLFLSRLIDHYSFYHEEWENEEIDDNKRIHNKFYNTYIPLIEWIEKGGDISSAIEYVALTRSQIDIDKYDDKLIPKIESNLWDFVEKINNQL